MNKLNRELPQYIYHLVEKANWDSIQQHGLLSTSMLVDLAGYSVVEKKLILHQQRTQHTVLKNGLQIRDQAPMPFSALEKCLIDMTPADWYSLLNSKIFFWLDFARLQRQQAACLPRQQYVLTIYTNKLLSTYAAHAYVSPINTGFARRKPALRGIASFVPYLEWKKNGWRSEAEKLGIKPRNNQHIPVELTINVPIPDIEKYITTVIL